MKEQELARLFFRELIKVYEQGEASEREKIEVLYRLLNRLYVDATKEEQFQFTTLFARIAYAGHKFNLSRQLQFYVHEFRREAQRLLHSTADKEPPLQLYPLGLKALAGSVASMYGQPIPDEIADLLPPNHFYKKDPAEIQQYISVLRVVVLEIDQAASQMVARAEGRAENDLVIEYNIVDRNENFNSSIRALQLYFDLPVVVNILDVEVGQDQVYRPRAFVVEPDYLVDVSAIAECFKDFGAEPLLYLLKKYLPFSYSIPLMIGNIANFFLDELMNHPEATFKDTFPKVFQLNPLAFTVFDDRELREIMQKAQKHFVNLKQMVHQGFSESEVQVADCFLEPSFYSDIYGIQGRLDVFYSNPTDPLQSAIIELKSGKTFKPNKWGLNHNHYVQTLLYDLLIKSVFDHKLTPTNFILYSGLDEKQLRFAPVTKSQQYEALQIRNQIVALEKALSRGDARLFQRLTPSLLPGQKGFLSRDLELFEKAYKGMRPLERKYFQQFSAFIAREHLLAKTGVQGVENINGLASLWLNDFEEKKENFELLGQLEIERLDVQKEQPEIVFNKTEHTNPLANFRTGDIAVLYPYQRQGDTVLNNQIFKGSITGVTENQITLRLRSRQFNIRLFEETSYWNIEHDLMDSSFNGMYRGLFQFVQFPEFKRDLLLTHQAPRMPDEKDIIVPRGLTGEQEAIFRKMVLAKDYFLLWGPPGTGKTSVMLKQMVSYLLNETDESILLLAYTNRAVDEICAAIESIDKLARQEYIRIGSGTSTAPRYRDRLLNTLMAEVGNRQGLKELIESHRVFVATVASMAGKLELLQFKSFSRVIIDEATQILEPAIVGLLPLFERFVLIGDHLQLPAVVVQNEDASAVADDDLHSIGLYNLRNSLFERLYKRCQQENWHWAYAQLSHQGRMHEEIMEFSSSTFYGGSLKVLPKGSERHRQQTAGIEWALPEPPSELELLLSRQRVLFLPTPTTENGLGDKGNYKTNRYEAGQIAKLVQCFQRIYAANNKVFTPSTLGVITPYRAQIAQIRNVLQEENIPTDLLTIDTVERYQGGARDIILLSLCANSSRQLHSLISHSDEGVDRKLNVALTRAREHLVILGNEQVLQMDEVYRLLMDYGQAVEL